VADLFCERKIRVLQRAHDGRVYTDVQRERHFLSAGGHWRFGHLATT